MAKLKARLDREGVKKQSENKPRQDKNPEEGPTLEAPCTASCKIRIYVGKVRHREAIYAGEHEAIIPEEFWDKVQERLRANCKVRRNGSNAKSPSLLVGLLYDPQGNRFTPFHADRRGKRYRYYVSQAKIQGRSTGHGSPIRIPARDIEEIVCSRIQSLLRSPEELLHATGAEGNSAAACESLIMAGKQLAKIWLLQVHG